MQIKIDAMVQCLRVQHHGQNPLTIRVTAGYESANTISSIDFDVPYAEASNVYIGQRLMITMENAP